MSPWQVRFCSSFDGVSLARGRVRGARQDVPAWRQFVTELRAFLPATPAHERPFGGLTARERELLDGLARLKRDSCPGPDAEFSANPGSGRDSRLMRAVLPARSMVPTAIEPHHREKTMDTAVATPSAARYAKCIEASKKVRWDIDKDVIRGRSFDFTKKFMPDRLSQIARFKIANPDERRFLSQIQGRTYANIFGLVERYIGAKILEVTRGHALGDQVVVESLVRFTDEELKHQELFRRLETMMAMDMPKGYSFLPQPNDVANAVLSKGTWAVLGLTCHIELFTLEHYRQSIDRDPEVSELWKDVFLFHMKEESQHAVLDEMEWQREDAKLTPAQRDQGVTELIELVAAVDGILQIQSAADAAYFTTVVPRKLTKDEAQHLRDSLLGAYRWQYIVSGVQNERFMKILGEMLNEQQMGKIVAALGPILASANAQ